ncbi:glycine zipper 2TM domain-containing protein [Pseudoduganella sp. SL102]|uniref:glycine zipper 2TM domain-containing protein n=1 Tax=Pseudoduganella sp. SL102 TaxID=2995154 RepID=UPI00248D2157|nr:glycine zipper 2TM domain-containing protein [Pseudoduganella sp. SL102]WBS01697.1 glycine zipper 2TM domain-containing protein [Pseudoduganella sp. SL102]
MEKIATASRIHPLFAAAAVSVIALSATGIAALTGVLPSSKAEPAAQILPAGLAAQQAIGAPQAVGTQQLAAAQPAAQQLAPQALQQPALAPEPAPAVRQPAAPERVVVREIVYREPAPRKVVHKAPVRSEAPQQQQQPVYAAAPVALESKPNYVAIGTGAVVGGLIGNQIGDGNGKKLATLAGIIGGGYAGNEIANRGK